MRILRICQDVPYPPDDGVRIEPYRSSKGLAERGHHITLLGFQKGERDLSPLREWCDLHVIPFDSRNSVANLARGVIERRPVNYIKYRDRRFMSTCLELLEKNDFDVVIVDYSAMGWYAFAIKEHSEVPVITRWHNVDSLIWSRWVQSQSNPARKLLGKIQLQYVTRFERELALSSDLCLTVGARDTEVLRELAPTAKVEFLPPGIDIDYYTPDDLKQEPATILLLASDYGWHPNFDAAKWLYTEIMPEIWTRVPEAKLYLTGRNATAEMKAWGQSPRVELTGFVPDEREIIAKATVMVVPMRLGGGIKLKALTAFASGRALVSTSAGAEGIPGLIDGEHLLICDGKDEFAAAVVQIMVDEHARLRMQQAGRAFVCCNYSWNAIVDGWENALRQVTESYVELVRQP